MNLIGKVLANRYEILGKVGEGGMATVYKAKCHLLNRYVAVKVLKDEYAKDEMFVKKFKTEAQSAAALTHPNIVSVYDVGSEDGINYIVMELLDSKTLKDYIEEKGALPTNEVLKISSQIASALAAAHKAHIIHRDIKPQNIVLSGDLVAKVTDFGIAKITNVSSATITNFGSTVGSVHYFSPEHAKGGYTDEKSDIYSLGVVMYEMATGKLPFDGDSAVAIALKHIQEDPVDPIIVNNKIPESLNQIILKAMSKNTALRYQSAEAMLEDINDAMETSSRRKRNNVEAGKTQVISIPDISENQAVPNLRMREPRRIASQNSTKIRNFDEKYKTETAIGEDPKLNAIKKKKKKKMIIIYTVIMLAIILIFALIFGPKLYRSFNSNVNQRTEYEVPNLKGMKLEDAISEYSDKGIEITQSKTEYSSEFEEGQIISQSQEAGTKSYDHRIAVVISKGTKMVEVPSVEGKDLKVATYELQDTAGFVIESIEEVNEKVAKGLIFSQEPKAGESVAYGSTIKLKISLGDGKETVLMPNVTGKTLDEAKKTLEDMKLTVNVKYGEDKNKSNGVVISQNYPQNQQLKEGDLVEITINKLIITKSVTIDISEFTKDIFSKSDDTTTSETTSKTASLNVMASVDGGVYNSIYTKSITKNDKTINFTVNGYEKVDLQIYINDKSVNQQTIKLK